MNLDKSYLYGVATLVGTTIGVGIFGLPYVASKSGFMPALFLMLILGVITLVLNLMYGEITLRTSNKGRLVSYCHKYIGESGKKTATVITLFSLYANILAYIIVGGVFLNNLLSKYFGGSEFTYSLIVFILISSAIYFSIKLISVVELFMVLLLLVAMSVILAKGVPFVDLSNLSTHNFSQSFIPFGIILFSFGALSAIPELEHIITKKQKRIKGVIIIGTIIPIIIYILFTAVILGISGTNTPKEALSELSSFLGNGVVTLGLIFGVLAIATSYLMIGINLKEVFWYDYHIGEKKAWALACFVPFIIFVLGLRDFITIVSITGGITGGVIGILVIIAFYKAKKLGDIKPVYEIKVPILLSAFMVFIYVLGIVYQFIY